MFRTRDFVLLLVTIVFLLVAIGATLWQQRQVVSSDDAPVQLADVTEHEYPAVVSSGQTIDRTGNLNELRKKIAESSDWPVSTPPLAADEVTLEADVATETQSVITAPPAGVERCSQYQTYVGQWPATGVRFEEREGARLVYEESNTVAVPNQAVATSAVSTLPAVQPKVLVQLPMPHVPAPTVTCLASDVVGIAKDGSLIRNSEAGLYGVFGAETVVGYALDGFPIYGVSDMPTDNCGGTVVAGQYRYYLSTKRDTILNCFAGTPVSL